MEFFPPGVVLFDVVLFDLKKKEGALQKLMRDMNLIFFLPGGVSFIFIIKKVKLTTSITKKNNETP